MTMAAKKNTSATRMTTADKALIAALRQISVNARQSLASSLCPKEQAEYELGLVSDKAQAAD